MYLPLPLRYSGITIAPLKLPRLDRSCLSLRFALRISFRDRSAFFRITDSIKDSTLLNVPTDTTAVKLHR